MARAHGKEAVVVLDNSGGSPQTISGDVDNVDAPYNYDEAEVSGFGDEKKSYILGQADTPISMGGKFETAANRSHAVLSGLLGGTAGYTFLFQPKGTATGLPKLSGEVLLQSYQIVAGLGGAVTWTAKLSPANSTGLVWSTN